MIAETLSAFPARHGRTVTQLGMSLAAVAIVGSAMALLAWFFVSLAPVPVRPPARSPFGAGVREAAPAATGLGAYILALQSQFYQALQRTVLTLKEHGAAVWSLVGLGFAYGVFHAAGPGHGKAVVAAYLVSSERALLKGMLLSFAAAVVQALVAIALVSLLSVAMRSTAATLSQVTNAVEIASFSAVAALGAALVWRKAGKLLGTAALARNPFAQPVSGSCGHVHLPPPEALNRLTHWREMAGVVLAAGMRPCAGALIILVLGLSQGLFGACVAATFAMAVGTALTTGFIATLAVFAKGMALRIAGGRGTGGALTVAGIELLAAAFILVLGASLLAGLWTGAGGS